MAGGRPAGLVVAGGRTALDALGVPGDPALMPFAARHRVVDVALATLHNSGIGDTRLVLPGGRDAAVWRQHLLPWSALHRSHVTATTARDTPSGLLARIQSALVVAGNLERASAVVVLPADQLLQVDFRPLLAVHHASGAEMTLLCVPPREAPAGNAVLVGVDDAGRVASLPPGETDAGSLAWTGGLIGSAALLRQIAGARPAADRAGLRALVAERHVHAADLLTPLEADGRRPYWHPTATVEDYYDAQMDLCTPAPGLDLWRADWPLPGSVTRLAPAKVVADAGGHSGQALNALLADGALVRGGAVIRSLVGHGVVVDAGAEVEDSVLLDGCHVGRGAIVRRAIVGPGVVIEDGRRVGYEDVGPGEEVLPSGLSLVATPSDADRALAAALS